MAWSLNGLVNWCDLSGAFCICKMERLVMLLLTVADGYRDLIKHKRYKVLNANRWQTLAPHKAEENMVTPLWRSCFPWGHPARRHSSCQRASGSCEISLLLWWRGPTSPVPCLCVSSAHARSCVCAPGQMKCGCQVPQSSVSTVLILNSQDYFDNTWSKALSIVLSTT